MRESLCVWIASTLLVAAGPAVAQTTESPPAKSPERPPLNLKLDEPILRGQPRITFGPRDGKGEQRPADTLPALGGNPSPLFDRPVKADPGSGASPYPKDTNPNAR
jgi:hypothetical protein